GMVGEFAGQCPQSLDRLGDQGAVGPAPLAAEVLRVRAPPEGVDPLDHAIELSGTFLDRAAPLPEELGEGLALLGVHPVEVHGSSPHALSPLTASTTASATAMGTTPHGLRRPASRSPRRAPEGERRSERGPAQERARLSADERLRV